MSTNVENTVKHNKDIVKYGHFEHFEEKTRTFLNKKYRQMLKTNTVKHNKDIVKYGQNINHNNKYR